MYEMKVMCCLWLLQSLCELAVYYAEVVHMKLKPQDITDELGRFCITDKVTCVLAVLSVIFLPLNTGVAHSDPASLSSLTISPSLLALCYSQQYRAREADSRECG